jgi:hypothetical protein
VCNVCIFLNPYNGSLAQNGEFKGKEKHTARQTTQDGDTSTSDIKDTLQKKRISSIRIYVCQ